METCFGIVLCRSGVFLYMFSVYLADILNRLISSRPMCIDTIPNRAIYKLSKISLFQSKGPFAPK